MSNDSTTIQTADSPPTYSSPVNTTMDNTPIPTLVEGFRAEERDGGFEVNIKMTINKKALDLIGCSNDMRITDVGIANLLASALVTMAQNIQAQPELSTYYGGEEGKHVPNVDYNKRLAMAKRGTAIAITHIETGAMFLRKSIERMK